MFDKMKDLMKMKKQADQIKKELDQASIECTDVEGIKIIINGAQKVQFVELDDSLFSGAHKDKLEEKLKEAMNAAVRQSQNVAAQKMKEMMPGLPGV